MSIGTVKYQDKIAIKALPGSMAHRRGGMNRRERICQELIHREQSDQFHDE